MTQNYIPELLAAAERGDMKTITNLLDKGLVDVNAANERGRTALLLAVWQNKTEAAKVLIDKGADVKHSDTYGDTALMLAAKKCSFEVTQLLIDKGADVNAANKHGATALIWAAIKDQVEIIKLLIAHGATVDAQDENKCTAFIRAAWNGSINAAKALIDAGANVNAVATIKEAAKYNLTASDVPDFCQNKAEITRIINNARENAAALLHAAASGDAEEVKRLIQKVSAGANVHATNTCGMTALMLAATYGHIDIVAFLLECGADIDAADWVLKETALMCAAQEGRTKMVDLLLQKGAKPDIVNIVGQTAEEMLANSESKLCALEMTSEHKDAAILRAINGNDAAAAKRLLKLGVSPYTKDSQGKTALEIAKASNHETIFTILKTAAMRRKGA